MCVAKKDPVGLGLRPLTTPQPGGAALLRQYGLKTEGDAWRGADWAFYGGLNNHSRAARRRARELRVARYIDEKALGNADGNAGATPE